jgi:hypothetical protein
VASELVADHADEIREVAAALLRSRAFRGRCGLTRWEVEKIMKGARRLNPPGAG